MLQHCTSIHCLRCWITSRSFFFVCRRTNESLQIRILFCNAIKKHKSFIFVYSKLKLFSLNFSAANLIFYAKCLIFKFNSDFRRLVIEDSLLIMDLKLINKCFVCKQTNAKFLKKNKRRLFFQLIRAI